MGGHAQPHRKHAVTVSDFAWEVVDVTNLALKRRKVSGTESTRV